MNCVFCGQRPANRLSKEHLLSKPICSAFGLDRGDTLVGRLDGDEMVSQASLEATLTRMPCAECNSGWMSSLEKATAAVFERWLAGTPLDDMDAASLRRWLAKTHLALCFLEGRSRGFRTSPQTTVIPDVMLAKSVFAGTEDRFMTTRFGIARTAGHTAHLWGFGTPTLKAAGRDPIGRGVATVSVLLLGGLQLWTVNSALPTPREDSVRVPAFTAPVGAGLVVRSLPTASNRVVLSKAVVDYRPLSRENLIAILSMLT